MQPRESPGQPQAPVAAQTPPGHVQAPAIVFEGIPAFAGGRALLYDSSRPVDAGKLALGQWIRRIAVTTRAGVPPDDLVLEVFIDDLSFPVARIPLAEAARPGGRTLSLWAGEDQRLVLALVEPRNRPSSGCPDLLVTVNG